MTLRKISKKVESEVLDTPRSEFYQAIFDVLRNARVNSYRAVNFVMVEAYWNIGQIIDCDGGAAWERTGGVRCVSYPQPLCPIVG